MTVMTEPDCTLAVICNYPDLRSAAVALAEQLRVDFLTDIRPAELTEPEFVVLYDQQGVSLQQTGRKVPGAIRSEFTGGAVDHRRKFGGGKGQMIAKAVGVKAGVYPRVLDVTAGLGKDAFVLATLGCPVTLLERSPVVHALLADGLVRARSHAESCDGDLRAIMSRLQLMPGDGRTYLERLPADQLYDVIYLDPMFPERSKSASVKKEMRAFHSVVGKDLDAEQLLEAALPRARYRVVVKRPRKAPVIGGRSPSFQLEGKSSRYDIYARHKLPDRLPAVEF